MKNNGTLFIQQGLRFTLLLVGLITLSGFTTLQSSGAQDTLWYVSIVGNNQSDCHTPQTPCATINAVFQKAEFQDNDTILVTADTYADDNAEVVVTINRASTIDGGWNSTFTERLPSRTAIDGRGRTGIYVTEGVSVTLISVAASGGNFDPSFAFNFEDLWHSDPIVRNALRNKVDDEASKLGSLSHFSHSVTQLEKAAIYNEGMLTLEFSGGGGLYGNGLYNQGTVVAHENSGFSAYMGQAMYNDFDGVLLMHSADLSNNTGRQCVTLGNNGIVEIIDSAIIYNVAEEAYGAICNAGEMVIKNVVLESNYASGNYPNEPSGGAIHNVGTLTITNSLFLHNQAKSEGGAIYNAGNLALYNVTIMNNFSRDGVGGIWAGGTVQASNSVFAHNESYFDAPDCNGTIHSQGYNLIQNLTNCEWQEAEGDILSVPVLLSVIPPYFYITKYSPLGDAGNPNGCLDPNGQLITTDSYGRPRIGRCDIGALEYDPDNDPFHYQLLPTLHHTTDP